MRYNIGILSDLGFDKPKNNRQWFMHYLFTDPEFTKEKDKICKEIELLVGNNVYGIMMLMQKNSLCSQLDRLGKEGKEISEHIAIIAKRFSASVETIEQGIRFKKKFYAISNTFKSIPTISIEDEEVVIRINGVMKLKDIIDSYNYIQNLQKQLPDYRARNRSKVWPDLIYAMYKQRLEGLTFKQIYNLYETRKLPLYDGDINITGEDNLERQYNKFKPAI